MTQDTAEEGGEQGAVVQTTHVVASGESLILIAMAPAVTGTGPLPGMSLPPIGDVNSPAFAAMDSRGKTTSLHPIFRQRLALLADLLASRGMKALITDGMRTFAEQDPHAERSLLQARWYEHGSADGLGRGGLFSVAPSRIHRSAR